MNSILAEFSLDNKVAIVTGAGKGIGRAIAIAFAEAGATVVLAARTEADLLATETACQHFGAKTLVIPTNTKSERQLKALVDTTLKTFGRIDILVNNAGGALPNDALNTSLEQFNNDYHFNVASPFYLATLCMPALKEHKGNIINITSAAARYSQKGFSSYGTTKAALTHLTRLLAADFAPDVRVNGIAPGTIVTDALSQFLDDAGTAKMIELTPLKALGKPEDIAAAALFLASNAAKWITGKIIEVDGGAENTTWPF
jgi:7-alpha-hydroxysteroid dehydrogenase